MEQKLFDACNDYSWNNRIDEVKEILKNNPTLNINWKNQKICGETALWVACMYGHVDIVRVLLTHPDIDVNMKNDHGETPFLIACSYGETAVVRLMLGDARVMINEPSNNRFTPLSWAAYKGHLEVIKWMISSGRDLDLGEEDGELSDAIGEAKRNNNTEVVSLLERFKQDELKTRFEIKREPGLVDLLVAEMFVLIVLHCDGYLEIKFSITQQENQKEEEMKAKRFFEIVSRLPMELQKIICHCVFDSPKDCVSTADFEAAFEEISKLIS